jgi:hypothetical protein
MKLGAIVLLLGLLTLSAHGQEVLRVRSARTGALFVRGEQATFQVVGASAPLVVTVVDREHKAVFSWQQPVTNAAPIMLRLDTARLPRLGWYQIQVQSGPNAAESRFALLPPPQERVPARQSAFGAIFTPTGSQDQITDIAHSLKLAGVRWVDSDIPLAYLNPREGVYDWTEAGPDGHQPFDACVHALHKEGLCLMLKFLGQADWVSTRTTKEDHAYWDSAINLSPPVTDARWTQVVTTVVKRYGALCDTWEVGNEPEGHGYFKGSDTDYLAYLRATAIAIRSAQPKATIVAASMYNGGGVLPLLVQHPELFDIMSVHYLIGPGPAESPIEHYRQAQADAGIHKVIWNTESRGNGGGSAPSPGETSHYRTRGALNQSPIKAYVRNFALGIPRVFVFSWNLAESAALVNSDGTPRWNAVEYRTMTDQLEGASFVREIHLGKDLSAYQFRRGKQDFVVAWSDVAGVSAPLLLTVHRSLLVTDVMGNSQAVPADNGQARLTLTYEPIFIQGIETDFQVK